MSFTRKTYDKQCYDKYLKAVSGVEQHIFDVPAPTNTDNCFNNNPSVRHSKLNNSTKIRDIEAENSLYNIDYRLGCDKRPANCKDGECKTQVFGGNSKEQKACDFQTSDTRLDNPASNLRGVGINRFEWPLNKFPLHEYGNISSRLEVKDSYVHKDHVPIDQTPALPQGGELVCPKTTQVCAPYV